MDYYVYIHRKKTNGEVFYVGKGCGIRAWVKGNRPNIWKRIVKKHDYTVEIVMDNLQEWYAYELEKDLIALYGRRCTGDGTLVNLTPGSTDYSGVEHPNADRNKYNFYNFVTKERFYGYRTTFSKVYKVNSAALFHTGKSVKNWICVDGKSEVEIQSIINSCLSIGLNNPRADLSVYVFKHKDGRMFKGTRIDFQNTTGVSPYHLFGVRRSFVVKGWYLLEREAEVNRLKRCNKQYTFQYENGERITCARWQLEELYGLTTKPFFLKKKPSKKVKGWSILFQ